MNGEVTTKNACCDFRKFSATTRSSAVYFGEVDMLRIVDIEGGVTRCGYFFWFECNLTRVRCRSDRVKMVVGKAEEVVYSGHWFCHA
jgi:hypothetical protein